MENLKHDCKMIERLNYIECDIKDLQSDAKEYTKDMSMLKESHTETKIYVKQIFDSLAQMTKTLNDVTTKPGKMWEELIKTVMTVAVTAAVTWFITK